MRIMYDHVFVYLSLCDIESFSEKSMTKLYSNLPPIGEKIIKRMDEIS